MKKKKKNVWDFFESMFEGDLLDLENIPEGATGYSIEVTYDGDKPVVRAKTFGNIDKSALVESLRKMYPGAKIIVDEEEEIGQREIRPLTEEEERKEKKRVTYRFNEKGELVKEGKEKKSIFDLLSKKKKVILDE